MLKVMIKNLYCYFLQKKKPQYSFILNYSGVGAKGGGVGSLS